MHALGEGRPADQGTGMKFNTTAAAARLRQYCRRFFFSLDGIARDLSKGYDKIMWGH